MADTDNPGFAAGIGQRSPVKRLAWALKGAPMRKTDLRLTALAGIAEGRKLRDRVTSQMLDANANPADAVVICLFAEMDLSSLAPGVPLAELAVDGTSDIALATRFADKLPIGFLVLVVDRSDKEQPIFGHARPLIVEARAVQMNEDALARLMRVIENELRQA